MSILTLLSADGVHVSTDAHVPPGGHDATVRALQGYVGTRPAIELYREGYWPAGQVRVVEPYVYPDFDRPQLRAVTGGRPSAPSTTRRPALRLIQGGRA